MQVMKAHKNWASRPADERFTNLEQMHKFCEDVRELAADSIVKAGTLRVHSGAPKSAPGLYAQLEGERTNGRFSHWAVGQMCRRAGAPASYLSTLPADMAADCINYGLDRANDADRDLIVMGSGRTNGNGPMVRAVTSDKYARIWNSDVTARLVGLQRENPNWQNPVAYKIDQDRNTGDGFSGIDFNAEKEPSGLYASDHDMFAFLVDESARIDDGSDEGMARGFFVWNSEVGASSFGIMTFLYKFVCGNHIVWGAKNVTEVRVRHVGDANERAFQTIAADVKRYADESVSETQAIIKAAKRIEFTGEATDVLDQLVLMAKKAKIYPALNRGKFEDALATAERRPEYSDNPRTLWAVVNGLTENSQLLTHADARVKTDQAAGKLLALAA